MPHGSEQIHSAAIFTLFFFADIPSQHHRQAMLDTEEIQVGSNSLGTARRVMQVSIVIC